MERKLQILTIIKIIYLTLILLFLIDFVLVLILQNMALLIVSIVMILIIISLYVAYHLLRVKIYQYQCPKCKHSFSISFVKDITSYNAGDSKKVLVCPNCNIKEIMKASVKNK